jgi:hypothetical protein
VVTVKETASLLLSWDLSCSPVQPAPHTHRAAIVQ